MEPTELWQAIKTGMGDAFHQIIFVFVGLIWPEGPAFLRRLP